MPDRIYIPGEYLERLIPLLDRYAPHAEVWAFGSRVSGKELDCSDLDLVLRCPENPDRPQQNLAGLREAIAESRIPILVDVLDWARIPPRFREEIGRAHAVVRGPLPAAD